MNSDTYLTIAAPAEGLYKDKGSRFLAFAYPVFSESDIKPLVDALKTEYYDARHHCYAWQLGIEASEGGVRCRANDDGAPAGSAGRRWGITGCCTRACSWPPIRWPRR